MKVLIAVDKFKGSLSAEDVCEALERGLRSANPSVAVTSLPLADGGDGSLRLLEKYTTATRVNTQSTDPLGRPIDSYYLMGDYTAYVELAVSSGMVLLTSEEQNPLRTSTNGTGQLMLEAIEQGAKEVYLFLGGSSTTDAGLGIASVLGCRFLDAEGSLVDPVGGNLYSIAEIETEAIDSKVRDCKIKLVCDVDNPLYGPKGAAHVYGPQKGASPADVELLDEGLRHVAKLLCDRGHPVADIPGTGAAGGIAAGLLGLYSTEVISGMGFFTEVTNLKNKIAEANLVITGEGSIDEQTASGKVVSGVTKLSREYASTVVAVCGVAKGGAAKELGLDGVYSVRERSETEAESMATAYEKLVDIGREIAVRFTMK